MKPKKSDIDRLFLKYLIDDKLTYSEIENKFGYKKGVAKVKVNRYKKQNLIELSSENIYRLTEQGNSIYRTPERLLTIGEKKVNIHLHRIKAKVLEINARLPKEKDFISRVETIIQVKKVEDYKVSELKNNDLYIFNSLFGTEIRATTKHILIKVPKFESLSVDDCLTKTETYFNNILAKIEQFFNIKLDTHYINQFWLANRHIEYVRHYLGMIHKRHSCMDLEIIDESNGEKLLYFDKSNGTTNTETASVRQGVDISYNLERLDKDIVNGLSLSEHQKEIADIRHMLVLQAEQNAIFLKNFNSHTALVQGAVDLINYQKKQIKDIRKEVGQSKLSKFF